MKKLIILISFLVSFVFSFGQAQQPRSGGSVTATDSNLFAGNSFRVPIFSDTAHANTNRISLDSAGKIIFTRDINWFWGRQTTPERKWIPFNNSSGGLTPSCGYPTGTHIVTYDSLLTFDVTGGPYVLCCDGIPRATIDGTVTLDSNDADFQRIDLIVLDTNGVNVVKGMPALNPHTPQTDSCQIILSYVLINAHDSVPASINVINIYDENYIGTPNALSEWLLDSSRNFTTVDTADLAFPVHLVHDLIVTNPSSNNSFKFQSPANIDLNQYGALKFYVRKSQAASFTLLITFFLDGVQQTLPVQVISSNGGANTYATFVVPLVNVRIIGTSTVNQITFQFGAPQTGTFYFDWIQLQQGFPIVNTTVSSGTVTSFGSGNLDSLLIPSVANPNTTPFVTYTKFSVPPYTALVNNDSITSQYVWGKLDLSTPLFTGLLPITSLSTGDDGTYLAMDGTTVVWQQIENDTTKVGNWVTRRVNPDPLSTTTDTLYFGYSMRDTALLSFDTYTGLDNHTWTITNGTTDAFIIAPSTASLNYYQAGGGLAQIYIDSSNTFIDIGGYSGQDAFIDSHSDPITGGIINITANNLNGGSGITINSDVINFNHSGVNTPAKVYLQFSDSLNVASPTRIAVWDADTLKSALPPFIGGFTPANSTDNSYPNKTLVSDDTFLYYRKSNGTWVKTPWLVF